MTDTTAPMTARAIRVPDAEWEAAQAAARALGTTVSAVVREALAGLVARGTAERASRPVPTKEECIASFAHLVVELLVAQTEEEAYGAVPAAEPRRIVPRADGKARKCTYPSHRHTTTTEPLCWSAATCAREVARQELLESLDY